MNTSILDNVMKNEQFFVLRSMFYLLNPSETYIKNTKEVPDLTTQAVPVYIYIYL